MIKKTVYVFLILIITSIIYLNYFGITTNKFNQNIQKKIQKNYPQFDLKLNDIKILFNISKLSVDLETDYPIILSNDEEIKLKTVSTTYDVISFFKKEFAIENLYIETEKNQIKKIIKLARSYKDSAQLLIIDKIIKTGKAEISIKLNFDENGNLIQNKYEVIADIENLSIELFNKQKIDKISGNLKYLNNKVQITNLKSEYQSVELFTKNISIGKKNKNYVIEGEIDSKENIIPSSVTNIFLKNLKLKNIRLSSKNNFSFNVSKKLKVSDLKLISKINLKKAEYVTESLKIRKYVPNFDNKITFLEHKININLEKKILLEGLGSFQVGEKKDDIKYNFEFNKQNVKFDLNLDITETPFKIDLINFMKEENEVINFRIIGEKKDKKISLREINIKKNNDIISLNEIN